jgi:hypothetical protein
MNEILKKMAFIGGEYLDSSALPVLPGVEVTVGKIEKLEVKRPGGKGEMKWVLHFSEIPGFPMVLGAKTNRKMLMAKLGDNSSEWSGKKIFIYRDPDVRFGPKVVGGIRIK